MNGLYVAIILAVGVLMAGLFLSTHYRVSKITKICARLSDELAGAKKDQELALQCSYGMGQRMLRLERRFKVLLETPKPEPIIEQPFSYTQATQMVLQGADVEAIAATCGISHSEAHLMRRLCEQGLAVTEVEA